MPWDSIDKFRDEDATEKRKRSRRRFFLGGRRSIDNRKALEEKIEHQRQMGVRVSPRSSEEEQRFPKPQVEGSNPSEGVKCACNRCNATVSRDAYTFPECSQCFLNLDGRCS
jgi:hypothetical protein